MPDPIEAAAVPDAPDASSKRRFADTFAAFVMRARKLGQLSEKNERRLLLAAVVLFAVSTVVALINMPPIHGGIQWWPVAFLALVGYPLVVVWMSGQYLVSARALGVKVPALHVLRIALLSKAANFLPLPGSVLVRAASLNARGSGYGRAISSSALLGLLWFGLTGVLAGPLLLASGESSGWIFIGIGVAVLVGTVVMAIALRPVNGVVRLLAEGSIVSLGLAFTTGVNFYMAMQVLRLDASFTQALTLSASGVIAATAGIFPGGLGLREAVAAGIAATIGVDPAAAVLATAIARIVAMIDLVIFSLALGLRRERPTLEEQAEENIAVAEAVEHPAAENPSGSSVSG